MEGALLDLGFPTPAPAAANQQTQPAQQQANFDPFGLPQGQPQPTQQTDGFDAAFGMPQTQAQQNQSGSPQPVAQQHQDLNFGVFEEPKASTQPQQQTQEPSSTDQNTVAPSAAADNTALTFVPGSTVPDVSQQQQTTEVTSAGEVAAAPSTPLEYKDKLKEIKSLFEAKWRLMRSEPFGEYLKAAGVGMVTRNRASNGTTDLNIVVKDEFIFFNSSTLLHSQIMRYKLDETQDVTWMKTEQSVFCGYQDRKIELQMTPSNVAWSKPQSIQYTLNERGELMVTYTVGTNVCRRVFGRVVVVAN